MATIKDVADLANVAVSTASLALRNDPRVKDSTRRRVHDVAKDLHYRPHGIARDLKTRRTETLCVLLHDLTGPVYSELLRGVQDEASRHGFNMIVCRSDGNEQKLVSRMLVQRRVDGAIVLAPDVSDETLAFAASHDLPLVVLDRSALGANIYQVGCDHELGGYLATTHLIERGHQTIDFINGDPHSWHNAQRKSGFFEALKKFGAKSKRFDLSGAFTENGGYQAGLAMIQDGDLPDAVFVANDEMAVGVIRALHGSGVRVPDDISVVGFDDIQLASYITPALTTVRQPMYEMGALAADLVFKALDGAHDMSAVTLPTELVVRASTRQRLGLYD